MKRFGMWATQISLALTFIVAGLVPCAVPNFTTVLFTGWYANEESPFTTEELVVLAASTREYTFFSQNRTDLYSSIVEVNRYAAENGRADEGMPVITEGDEASVGAAFDAADEAYVLTTNAVDHLDDVSKVVMVVFIVGFLALCVAAGGIMNAYFMHQRSELPQMLVGGGAIALALMVIFGAWLVLGFDSLFNAMHGLLFADGTWTFPADSLLISMFPAEFWRAMGILWLSVSGILAIISIVLGKCLNR